uniref:Uncharacterized protein n=1 Tax=Clytia hemisphaerica TaxID=252671 RepID=A0A7M5V7E0_9CNID|eukprot:TCONS_00002273-protein
MSTILEGFCISIFLVFTCVKGTLSIECFDCSGKIEYCNKTETTKTCHGSQFSCLLRFSSTKVWVIENGRLVSEIQERVSKTCAVESRLYCEDQKKIDPNMDYCKAHWCYKDRCNFELKQAGSDTLTNNKIDPYGWYRTTSSARKNHSETKALTVWLVCICNAIFIRNIGDTVR